MRIEVILQADSTASPAAVRAELESLLAMGRVKLGLRTKGITQVTVVAARAVDDGPSDTPLTRPPKIA